MTRTSWCLLSAVLATCLTLGGAPRGAEPQRETPKGPGIKLNHKTGSDKPATFDVAGLDAADLAKLAKTKLEAGQWAALFAVYVEAAGVEDKDVPAVGGSYRVEEGMLRFEPRYPLTPGVTYRAVFDPNRLPGREGTRDDKVVAEFAVPKPAPKPTTVVTHVYPTRNRLPENHLRFYFHFSAPMRQGDVYRHIHLLDAKGKEIEEVFLELGEELWDAEGKRFTLFFHPGRIKKGLKPREELGPTLEDGKEYTLVIDFQWEDAKGNPLKDSYRKTFKATAADDEPVDPKKWALQTPPAGKSEPLTVRFGEPLDHALLQRMLWVTDAKGQKVAGTIKVSEEETCWQFTPEQPWPAGTYQLVVDTALEDLAGNKVGEPFEVDVFKPIQKRIETKTVQREFQIRAGERPK
jgi:hypothetical protein